MHRSKKKLQYQRGRRATKALHLIERAHRKVMHAVWEEARVLELEQRRLERVAERGAAKHLGRGECGRLLLL